MTITKKGRARMAAGGRKGGKAKVAKGFAKLDKTTLKQLTAKGGRASKRVKK